MNFAFTEKMKIDKLYDDSMKKLGTPTALVLLLFNFLFIHTITAMFSANVYYDVTLTDWTSLAPYLSYGLVAAIIGYLKCVIGHTLYTIQKHKFSNHDDKLDAYVGVIIGAAITFLIAFMPFIVVWDKF